MVKKILGILLAIATVSIYLTFKEEGDQAFGGIFAPVESVRANASTLGPVSDPLGVTVTGSSVPSTSQTNYKQLVDRVRNKANAAMDKSVERSSHY